MVYGLPWNSVPAYIYCGLLEYFRHFLYLIIGLFRNRDVVYNEVIDLLEDKFCDSNNSEYGLITYSNRFLFDQYIEYLRIKKGRNLRVGLSSFLHTGYNRVLKWTQCEEYVIAFNDDFTVTTVDENKLSKCDVILLTHCFGSPFNFDIILNLAKKYNIPIYEDCVQIGYMGASPFMGNKQSTIRAWSGGQDKIPIAFGGGMGIVKTKALRDDLLKFIRSKNPMDTLWGRYKHLCGKLPLIMIYRNIMYTAWFIGCFIGYYVLNHKLDEGAMFVRRKWGGFVHGRRKYSKLCTTSQLLSIKWSLTRSYSDNYAQEIHHRQYFVKMCKKHLGEKQLLFHFPWINSIQYNKSSNFYYHFRVKNREIALKLLADKNWPTMPCQAWFINKEQAPNNYKIKEQLLILPNCYPLNEKQLEKLAKVFKHQAFYK